MKEQYLKINMSAEEGEKLLDKLEKNQPGMRLLIDEIVNDFAKYLKEHEEEKK